MTYNLCKILIEAGRMTADKLDIVQDVPGRFAEWRTGLSVKVGERYCYDGELYEVIQAHETQASWTPDTAKSLFKSVTGGLEDEGGEIILDFVQPTGAHDAYQKGDKVRYNNVIYESLINNNSWSPDAYAQAWKAIEEN